MGLVESDHAVRLTKSHPYFEKVFTLANDLAIAKNPQRWTNLSQPGRMDVAEPERLAIIEKIKEELARALAESETPEVFVKFIRTLKF